jgi:hypothetical protein
MRTIWHKFLHVIVHAHAATLSGEDGDIEGVGTTVRIAEGVGDGVAVVRARWVAVGLGVGDLMDNELGRSNEFARSVV